MKVQMRKEEAVTTGLDVGRFESSTVPFDRSVVVDKVKGVGAPVDLRVGLCEPWFAEDQVVLSEWVEDRVDGVTICFAFEGDRDGVPGDGG